MKKIFFIFIYCGFTLTTVYGQLNIVPNWSFEDTIKCVNSDNEFTGYVANWNGQGGGFGLCYLTAQCNGFNVGVPLNEFGYQYAHTGVSYAGIYTYVSDTASDRANNWNDSCYLCNFRNYIEVKLNNPLIVGTKYYVTFYVSLGNVFNFACNDIGAYLSDSALSFINVYSHYLGGRNLCKDNVTPQIANNPITNPLTDTLNWMKVTGTYIANGGEQYIIIGNFKNDTVSHIQYLGQRTPQGTGAYYYIDDVFVTTDSALAGASELTVESEKIKVYPNPASTMLNIEVQNNSGQ